MPLDTNINHVAPHEGRVPGVDYRDERQRFLDWLRTWEPPAEEYKVVYVPANTARAYNELIGNDPRYRIPLPEDD
jgi:hypothetical protein